jgi:hypothetical protein
MSDDEASFPCPSCGFEVFSSPPGSFEICEVCGWEDDHVQLRFPALSGGANKLSLAEHQHKTLAALPPSILLAKGFRRASAWRPLVATEIISPPVPTSGSDYFAQATEDAPPYYWHRTAFERVYMVWDLHDGARSGLACFRGEPHYFDCELDRTHGGYNDIYQLWPIDQELLALATEQWQLYSKWERRFHSGEVSVETHPGHRGQNARYDELEDEIDRRLSLFGAPACRALADFRACDHQAPLPPGCLAEMEVKWVAVV